MAQINSKLTPSGSVTLPSSGSVAFFTEAADAGRLYIKDSEGNVYPAVDASGSGGISSVQVNYTGSEVGDATILDFEGSGINDITVSGTTATINVSGGGSGSSGTSGANGAAGTSGVSGTDGTSGSSGADGTSGSSGATGDAGTSGSSGDNGTSGSSGANGTSGSSGENGATGAAGTSGSSGIDGTSGSSGETGATGAAGTSGSSGETGAAGTSGSSGETGASGTSGESGTSGSSGADGTSGSSGADGTSGSSGADGTSGSSGADGTSGSSGADGTSGSSGANGAPGTSGSSGASGAAGADGSSGSSGANGAAGTSGTSGADGAVSGNTAYGEISEVGGSSISIGTSFQGWNTGVQGRSLYLTFTSGTGTTGDSYTIPTGYGGDYLINASYTFESSGNDTLTAAVFVNGVEQTTTTTSRAFANNTKGSFSITDLLALSVSDEVDIRFKTGATTSFTPVNISFNLSKLVGIGDAGTSGSSGVDGTSGSSGSSGATGDAGTSGSSGSSGATGNAGTSGSSGANGTDGTSGSSGATGNAGTSGSSGADGAPGAGGGASFNPIIRYEVTSGSNIAQIMSSGNVEGGLSWTRSTTTLTVTHTAHGLSAGDFVVIRNMSEDYSYLEIQTVPTVNTFTLTVANSGGTSGSEGAYIPAFDVTSLTDTALTFASPSAGNVQMISCTIFIDQMEDASITVTVPSNAITNGAGKNNSLNSRVPASFDYYDVSGATSSKVGSATLSFSTTTNHNVYSLSGGLDIFGDALYTLQF